MIRANKIDLAFGLETVYDDADFSLGDKDKTGIVGVNGAGKTTLFRVMLGTQELDGGTLSIGSARVLYLQQEIEFDDRQKTVWEYLCEGRPVGKLEARLNEIYDELSSADERRQTALLAEMANLQSELDGYDAYNAENVLLELIFDMQIDDQLLDMRLGDLSGGQKSKVAFARVLYSNAQILLLDEPTNHLDASTKSFVTKFLKEYNGSVMIISHDVAFLNAIVNKILFVNKTTQKTTVYDGNYSVFKRCAAKEQRVKE